MSKRLLSVKRFIRVHPRRAQALCIVLAVLLAGLAGYFILADNQAKPIEAITYSTDQPDETKPGDDFKWQGDPNDPKKIVMPSVGIEGYIQNVGVDQNKQVAVPNNVHMAGWFVDSVRPGEKGLSIIDGHVTGRTSDGIFKTLGNVVAGDRYTIEFGNGSTKQFEVIRVTNIPAKDAASVVFSQDPKQGNQVNLVTCGGEFDRDSNQYKNRIIVASKLAQ